MGLRRCDTDLLGAKFESRYLVLSDIALKLKAFSSACLEVAGVTQKPRDKHCRQPWLIPPAANCISR